MFNKLARLPSWSMGLVLAGILSWVSCSTQTDFSTRFGNGGRISQPRTVFVRRFRLSPSNRVVNAGRIRPLIQDSSFANRLHRKMFSTTLVTAALNAGQQQASQEDRLTMLRIFDDESQSQVNPVGIAANRLNRPSRISLEFDQQSRSLLTATRFLADRIDRNNIDPHSDAFMKMLSAIDVSSFVSPVPNDKCLHRVLPCDRTSRYRSADGWCNNLLFPTYGSSFREFRRLASAKYQDVFNEPRKLSVLGGPLPNTRLVSATVHTGAKTAEFGNQQSRMSHFVMQWGQYMDHDMSLTPISAAPDGTTLDCSDCDSAQLVSDSCWPIRIQPGDPHFPPFLANGKPRCFNFARSLYGQRHLGCREQINELTAYLDASQVYGSDSCAAEKLRSMVHGKLLSQAKSLLPGMISDNECRADNSTACFEAGDERVNEHLGLAAVHTVWMRLHNHMAEHLVALNPHWDDERIYQEVRHVIAALHQQITYAEFLPKVLGSHAMFQYDLDLQTHGYSNKYDAKLDATISNAFATAAFRFGHTLIGKDLMVMDPTRGGQVEDRHLLRKLFFNPTDLHKKDSVDKYILGFATQHSEIADGHFVDEIQNHLFEQADMPFSGLDLPALNMQRGRDHGLPGYTTYLKAVGLPVPNDFNDLYRIMPFETVGKIRSVYKSVHDIDLFCGMMCELPEPGALVGPLGTALLGEQFRRLKLGDRFWYENGDGPGRFTPEQLKQIRKVTLAKVLCTTCPKMEQVQPDVMQVADDFRNALAPCDVLPALDLAAWKEPVEFCEHKNTKIAMNGSAFVSPCVFCMCTEFGVKCYSNRVSRCGELLERYPLEAVRADPVCVAQCYNFVRSTG